MIVFKLSESTGSLENQYAADMEVVHEMLDVMDMRQYKCRIVKLTRLGRPESTSTMRPLRVQFSSYLDREAVVRNGYLLAESDDFRAVGVSRDLIRDDRIVSRNNYLLRKHQNQQNEARTGTNEATAPNTAEETSTEVSNETETATQGNTDSAATGGGTKHPLR